MTVIEQAVKAYRTQQGESLRGLAKVIGVSYSVLYRFESGKQIDGRHWARILRWLITAEVQQPNQTNT
jgi:transcriptional regulator with XRE-family HTH domain